MQRMNRVAVSSPNGTECLEASEPRPKRTRCYRKRVRVGMPQHTAPAVRQLWKSSSLEERQAAHKKGTLLLSMWLGRKSKSDVAQELALPPLRVWQLSQMALSGMLAGLLKQPRPRRGKEGASMSDEESPSQLKKRVLKLEQENRDLREVLELMRMMPSPENRPSKPPAAAPAGTSRREKKRASRASPPPDRGGSAGAKQTPAG